MLSAGLHTRSSLCSETVTNYPVVCMSKQILVADVGGTRSRFAHFSFDSGELQLERSLKLATGEASHFAALMENVRLQWPQSFDVAVLAVAGPVTGSGRTVRLSNVPWPVDLDEAGDLLPADTRLLNDFTAQGWACLCPEHQDLLALTPEIHPAENGAKAVLGGGTGLGLCALLPGPRVLPSEGGHAPFALTPEEADYGLFVRDRGGRLDGDHLLSGRGLTYLHAYHAGEELSPPDVAAKQNPKVIEWYARFCGRMAQTWALFSLATGGVCVTGGIAAANPVLVTHPAFRTAFCDCPKFEDTLRAIPLYLVRNTDTALWGAALYAAFGERPCRS